MVLAKKIAAAALVVAAASSAQAQVRVELVSTSKDVLGRRLAYEIREAIAASRTVAMSSDEDDFRMRLSIVTIDPEDQETQLTTVYSAVILAVNPKQPAPYYITNFVGTCGGNKIKTCANNLLVNLSSEADQFGPWPTRKALKY